MTAKSTTVKKAAQKPAKSFEESLWKSATIYKLAKVNLALRGLATNLGEVPADTFFKDQHPDLKADYIIANLTFNLKDWRADDELVHDGRWNGYDTPPTGNANYAWILHMVSKLSAAPLFHELMTTKPRVQNQNIAV